jgi:hypothetical protein
MSDKEIFNKDLKAIESELAALVPRCDQLDPRWRAFLGKAADLNAGPAKATAAHSPCSASGDHLFLCVYCGASRPRISRIRRWAWPAAFSAMTAAATALLLMFAIQPESQPSRNVANLPATKTRIPATTDSPRSQLVSESPIGWASNSGRWRQERLYRLTAGDPQLFDLALREYLHQPPMGNIMVAANHFQKESIPTAQQLMNEMLKRPN